MAAQPPRPVVMIPLVLVCIGEAALSLLQPMKSSRVHLRVTKDCSCHQNCSGASYNVGSVRGGKNRRTSESCRVLRRRTGRRERETENEGSIHTKEQEQHSKSWHNIDLRRREERMTYTTNARKQTPKMLCISCLVDIWVNRYN